GLHETVAAFLIGNPDGVRFGVDGDVAGAGFVGDVAEAGEFARADGDDGNVAATAGAVGDVQAWVIGHFVHSPADGGGGGDFSRGAIEQHQFVRAGDEEAVAFRHKRDAMRAFIRRERPVRGDFVAGRIDDGNGVFAFDGLVEMFEFRIERQILHAAAIELDGGDDFFRGGINHPDFAGGVVAFVAVAGIGMYVDE